jgi:hypothetical protein
MWLMGCNRRRHIPRDDAWEASYSVIFQHRNVWLHRSELGSDWRVSGFDHACSASSCLSSPPFL